MQSKPIRTYSRKRKRTPSPQSNRTTIKEITPPATAAANASDKHHDAHAATTLPSPLPTSSPSLPSTHSPLQPIHPNTAATPPTHPAADPSAKQPQPTKPPTRPKKLTQLTLDLGGNPRRRCHACRMEYIPSNAEDARLHRAFHRAAAGGGAGADGVDIPAGLSERWRVVKRCARRGGRAAADASREKTNGEGAGEGVDVVVEVGRHDASGVRNLARRVLAVVEMELGGVGADAGDSAWRGDGQKAYLYVRGGKCVGLCLAERVAEAFAVLPSCAGTGALSSSSSSSISIAAKAGPAVLGISRIWVAREFRRLGIARELLETARREFVYGAKLRKDDMAFSQPTDSGGKLARAWFGTEDGWMVYDLSRRAGDTAGARHEASL